MDLVVCHVRQQIPWVDLEGFFIGGGRGGGLGFSISSMSDSRSQGQIQKSFVEMGAGGRGVSVTIHRVLSKN